METQRLVLRSQERAQLVQIAPVKLTSVEDSLLPLLRAWAAGDTRAFGDLFPLVYQELRIMARGMVSAEPLGARTRPTVLVHELYLRLNRSNNGIPVVSREHFFSLAARAIRQILIDRARKRNRATARHSILATLDPPDPFSPLPPELDIEGLDRALERLRSQSERQARIAELRFFLGMSIQETAHALDISPATLKRDWAVARLFLLRELNS